MKENYVITILVTCDDQTELRKATDLACDCMTKFSSDIKVTDTHIDFDTDTT